MSATTFGTIIILLFAAYSTGVFGVKIKHLVVPEYFVVTNDSPDFLVLDCVYELKDGETNVVVKWQRNGENIYQWITGNHPTAFPHMKDKINDTFEVSDDKLQRYRALFLMNLTTDDTGDYKCLVTADNSVHMKVKHLEILDFRNFTLEVNHKSDQNDIHVSCEAKNVFPKPFLQLTLNKDDILPINSHETVLDENGYFDASVKGTLSNDGVESDTIFGCSLSFDGINYTANRFISFSGDSGTRITSVNLITILLVMIPLIFAKFI